MHKQKHNEVYTDNAISDDGQRVPGMKIKTISSWNIRSILRIEKPFLADICVTILLSHKKYYNR